ncbi:MAG: XRE family transcriptional regulator [Candidatus Sulfotelmatobacter sp.]
MASPTSEPGSSKAAELSAPKIAPDIIAESLKPFSIGEKLRTLRLRKKLGLVELGKHTGFSAALISKLERGKLYPTLPTLVRIAAVFNVGLEYFFNDERKRHVVAVVRKQERQRFPERPGTTDVSYFFEALDYPANSRKLSSYFADFQKIAREKLKPHTHPGVELLYMLTGTLVVTIGSEPHQLAEGDSLYFDSSVPHTYWKADDTTCSALIVTAA